VRLLFELDNRVEGLAGRLEADLGVDHVVAVILEREPVDERLRNRL
jgi:hypothetical protein